MNELGDSSITTPAGDVNAEITVGVALGRPEDDAEGLLARARAMMRRENPATSASGAPRRRRRDDHEASIGDLTRAMSHGDIKAFVQPVADLHSGQLVGYRGFARWWYQRQMLKAGAFIDVVADTPLATVIDRYIARETAAVIALRQRAAPLHLYTPGSNRLVADVRTEQYLAEIADAFALAPTQVHIEVDERCLSSWTPSIFAALRYLRDSGIRASEVGVEIIPQVDDAARYEFDELRLSRRASNQAVGDEEARDHVARLVLRAHQLGLTVTASGVDDEQLRAALRELGCELATGDVYDRARPANAVD